MTVDPISPVSRPVALDVPQSAISWAAIWAGAAIAVAASIVLTLAGAGLGYDLAFSTLASRSSLHAFTPEVGAGAIVIQVLSAALGGYVAGRLRITWIGVHDHESHFRDTAHGLIVWAVATIADSCSAYGASTSGMPDTHSFRFIDGKVRGVHTLSVNLGPTPSPQANDDGSIARRAPGG